MRLLFVQKTKLNAFFSLRDWMILLEVKFSDVMMTLKYGMLIESDAEGDDTYHPHFIKNQYQDLISITLSLFAVRIMSTKDKLIESV